MNTLPPAQDIPQKETKTPRFLIGVRLKNRERSRQFDPGSLQLRVCTQVMVESKHGVQMGIVASNKVANFRKDPGQNFPKVLRVANDNDLQAQERRLSLEARASKHLFLVGKLG